MSEVTDPVVQEMLSEPAPELEEPAPSPDPAALPEPAEESAPEETAPEEPAPSPDPAPTTQEVVQNVQEILSSTDTSASGNDLENRVKVLEERLDKLIQISMISNGRLKGL